MKRGPKRKPTKIKELQGTLRPSRVLENEMSVSICEEIPSPPNWLSEIGQQEWQKVCSELYNKQMLFQIDLVLIAAYCNEISLYIETEKMLREKGRIQVYKNDDGSIKHAQAIPYQKIAKDALNSAIKLATQFGMTPSSRSGIEQPTMIQQNNEYNFFE